MSVWVGFFSAVNARKPAKHSSREKKMSSHGKVPLLWVLVWAAWLITTQAKGQEVERPEVVTKYGRLRGKEVAVKGIDRRTQVFLGIPFAKPPVGSLRFSPPQQVEPWHGVRDATSFPPICLQDQLWLEEFEEFFKMEHFNFTISEDCLYLNIYSPAPSNNKAKLPVMMWIHGGSLLIGGAWLYDGSALSAYEDVVVVAIQYRLGITGFFSTGDEHARGNWGFLDQVAALHWIQENIEHFGGDPGSVTIFGESAGGISVSALVLSQLAKGLFHKAISESGVALFPTMFSLHPEAIAKMVANISGCETMSSAAMVHCLRKKPEEEIILKYQLQKEIPFIPAVVDGVFIQKNPEDLMAAKEFSAVPYIIGITNHEYGWFIPYLMGLSGLKEGLERETITSVLENMLPLLSVPPEGVPLIVHEYLGDANDTTVLRDQFLDLMGDAVFLVPSIKSSRYHKDSGSPVYFYEFQHPLSSIADLKPDFVKADHGDEISFVFGTMFIADEISSVFRVATEEEKHLSRTVMKYWANFARNGNPNSEGLVEWPVYNLDEEYLELNLKQKRAKKLKENRVEFWTRVLPEKIKEKLKDTKQHSEL
ncbi:fatty acyl-CoA hydrolase precursor, medium chain isoform X1 [Alligator mississippiensis]|uniref:fatty acyl-CoA hydrolase precursor, medium chain isoform X1 n=2 Tax=Alligator mississippiensis TaxID=8496 RepID=UPI002877448E|nr:fatty acyl-CoA hydrolase precursor, medium chain isoform X1 [Alligator mississippiensis]XP_059569857.1 fatty acyl-CoA hydrolase precursor, medium chain isoform X1 [Alligator mississippiensis]